MNNFTYDELANAADKIFHYSTQLFSYYAWTAKIAPKLDSKEEGTEEHVYFVMTENAVIDGHLINLRRLNEFFSKKQKTERNDDLRAYHFGFDQGRFLDPKDMEAIHKRIAHSTINHERVGDVTYEMLDATELALQHVYKFFDHISDIFYEADDQKKAFLREAAIMLLEIRKQWWIDAGKI